MTIFAGVIATDPLKVLPSAWSVSVEMALRR
jgi:hypothetical protein